MAIAAHPLRVNLKVLIALVAACASVFFVLKTVSENGETKRFTRMLRDGALDERLIAISRVAAYQPGEEGVAIPGLIAALRDPDRSIRFIAARALGDVLSGVPRPPAETYAVSPEWAHSVTSALIESLEDTDPQVRVQAMRSLAGRPVIPAEQLALLTAKSKSEEAAVAAVATGGLARIQGTPRDALLAMIASTKHADARVRTAAIRALVEVRERQLRLRKANFDASAAEQAVIALIGDTNRTVSLLATHKVGEMAPLSTTTSAAAAALLAMIRRGDDNLSVYSQTLFGIARGSPEAAATTDALVSFIEGEANENPDRRNRALEQLGSAAGAAKAAAPKLLAQIRRLDGMLPHYAWTLHNVAPFSPECREAANLLIDALNQSGDRQIVSWPKDRFGWQGETPRTEMVPVRWLAIEALSGLRSDALSALPALRAATKDPDKRIREAAASSVESIENAIKAPSVAAGR
jgi:HEAT repeat protein